MAFLVSVKQDVSCDCLFCIQSVKGKFCLLFFPQNRTNQQRGNKHHMQFPSHSFTQCSSTLSSTANHQTSDVVPITHLMHWCIWFPQCSTLSDTRCYNTGYLLHWAPDSCSLQDCCHGCLSNPPGTRQTAHYRHV